MFVLQHAVLDEPFDGTRQDHAFHVAADLPTGQVSASETIQYSNQGKRIFRSWTTGYW